MKNILIIHQSAVMYGSDRMLYLTVTGLDTSEFFPVVVLPAEGPLKTELEKKGIKVVVAPVLKVYRKMFTPGNLLGFLRDIKKAVEILDSLHKTYNFQIVYSNTLAVLLGIVYARKRKIKHLWHVHEIIVHPKIFANTYPKLLNRFADIVICNSKATLDNLVKRKPELFKKAQVIYNGPVFFKEENSIALKSNYGFEEEDIVITLAGRISRLKGHKWLLETFSKYLKQTPAKLLFVGSPVPGQEFYLTETNSIIQREGLEGSVKIIPYINSLNAIWQITDIAVMPSTEAESFGLVALEAMLSQKPVVGSRHGGLAEIVLDNETGFLAEPGNEKQLADALLKLIGDEKLRRQFGSDGYKRAKEVFSSEKYIESITNALQNL